MTQTGDAPLATAVLPRPHGMHSTPLRLLALAALFTPAAALAVLEGACSSAPPTEPATQSTSQAQTPSYSAPYDVTLAAFTTAVTAAQTGGMVPDLAQHVGKQPRQSTPGRRVRSAQRRRLGDQVRPRRRRLADDVQHRDRGGEEADPPVFDGAASNPLWVAAFQVTTGAIPITRSGLGSGSVDDDSTIEYWLQYAALNALIPSTLSIYGTASAPQYALVLEPNSANTQWSAGTIEYDAGYRDNLVASDYAVQWSALTSTGNRASMVNLDGDDHYVALFRDDAVSAAPETECHDLTRAQFDTCFTQQTAAG